MRAVFLAEKEEYDLFPATRFLGYRPSQGSLRNELGMTASDAPAVILVPRTLTLYAPLRSAPPPSYIHRS